MEKHHRFLVYW